MSVHSHCAFCGAPLADYAQGRPRAEACFPCFAPLCFDCWDRDGSCLRCYAGRRRLTLMIAAPRLLH